MNLFRYSMFYSLKKKTLPIEDCFSKRTHELTLYEKQYLLTKDLYASEWNKEYLELNEEYKTDLAKANEEYQKTYAEMEGEDEDFRHQFADHKSNSRYVDHWFYESTEDMKFRYNSFFDIYSKSVVMTLYSLVESTLKEICLIAQSDLNKKIAPEDLDSKNYLMNSINYFDLVLEIPIDTITPLIQKLEKIQKVRNKIAHENSEVTSLEIEEIIKNSNGSLTIEEENGGKYFKIVKAKYVLDFFELIREIFEEAFWLIDERYENKFLLKGLNYWFGMLDEKVKISHLEITKIKKGERKVNFRINSRKHKIKKFNCRIALSRNTINEVNFIEQTNLPLVEAFNQRVTAVNSFIYDYVFPYFNQSSKKTKVELLTFPLE